MAEYPLISVIMPFYNVSAYLEEAVKSVLHQTYTQWELLLIDDGSTDGSSEIALRYAESQPDRICYLQHPGKVNMGTSPSRNLGIRHSKGDYLALLDADDYWLPEKLAYQVSLAQQYPKVSMICGTTLYWYSWSDGKKEDVAIPVGGPQDEVIWPPSAALVLYPLGLGAAPCLCSIMLKKEAVLRNCGFEGSFTGLYQFYEDQAFLIKIYLHEAVFISSAMLDYYRQRENSNMSLGNHPEKYAEVRQYFLRWLDGYLDQQGLEYPEVREKIKEALRQYRRPMLRKIKSKIKRIVCR
jgi:glycosyltransferase involved in cell wall biosynthesis